MTKEQFQPCYQKELDGYPGHRIETRWGKEEESISERIISKINAGIKSTLALIVLTCPVWGRACDHKLRQAASTRPLLQDGMKAYDFIAFAQGAPNPHIPPNYYQWHMEHRGQVPYPYPNWDHPPIEQKN